MKKILLFSIFFFTLLVSFANAEPTQLSFDGFESRTFCGGAGWSDSCWTVSGSTAIRGWSSPYEGNRHVWLRSNTGVLSRTVDTTGYGTVTVSFAVKVNSFEASDRATFSIIVDGGSPILIEEWLPIDSDNTWHYLTYDISEYVGDSLTLDFRSLMSDLGDEIHFDNIEVSGEFGVVSEVSLSMENNYVIGSNTQILFSSTETSTLHTLELSYPNETIFCEKVLLSPSVSQTSFSTMCSLPNQNVVDARAYFYVTNDESINATKYFNVLNLDNNPDMLKISQVYFSEQVLQGGSTEIFAILDTELTIDNIYLELTFPDSSQRVLPMHITPNNEYRAFITDTYRYGNTSFKIIVQSDTYYAEYENYYVVARYTTDFVDVVQDVRRILEPTIQVHGTEYRALDPGRMFVQLLDGYNAPITDSSCYMSIYYPNNIPFKYKQKMSYVDEGLYYLDFIVPYMNGVYMASSYCIVEGAGINKTYVYDGLEGGISGGTGWAGSWTLNGAVISTTEKYAGTYSLLQADDDNPTRSITGSSDYSSVTISFYHRTSDMENGEYYYVYVEDASGTDYQLLAVTDGDDDGVWKFSSTTLNSINDNFNFSGTVRFYLDSNGATEATDYLYVDEINLEFSEAVSVNEIEYQVVRGSGEVHVTSDGEYTWELDKGELYFDNFYEGFRQYYTIYSQVYTDTEEVEVSVPIYEPFPCDHVLGVELYNGTAWNTISDVRYEYNLNGRNRCNVKFDMDLETLETYQLRTDSENYWKQKILGDYQDNLLLNDLMEVACINYQVANGFDNYTVPVLNASYGNNTLYVSCLSFFNAYYHYEEHLVENFLLLIANEANFTTDQMNFLESSFIHIENAGHEVRQYGTTIATGLNLGNSYSLAILSDPYPPVNPLWATYFAGISSSYNLYANSVSGQSNVLSLLDEINYSINNIDLNISGLNITTDIGEIPLVMIGGTEYKYQDEGLVAVRLTKTTGSSQSLITGATCQANILYPNVTTSFVINASMTEYGSGIYYYNFTVPSNNGVYIYSVDCTNSGKDYFSMSTFHVSPFYNWSVDLSNVINYLSTINTTVTTIDGRTLNIENIVTDTNNKIVLINGTLYNIYDLLVAMNSTINSIYSFAESIDANVIEINGTLTNVETIVLDVQGTLVTMNASLVTIENNVNTLSLSIIDINDTLYRIENKIDNVVLGLLDINGSVNVLNNALVNINGTIISMDNKIDAIYNAMITINGTVNNIENVVLQINGSVTNIQSDTTAIISSIDSIEDAIIYINATTLSTNNLAQYVNTTTTMIYDNTITIIGTINDIENVTLTIQSDVATINGILSTMNTTLFSIDGKIDLLASDLFYMNNTINNINSAIILLQSDTQQIIANQIIINGTINNIEDTLVYLNGSIADVSLSLDDINNSLQQFIIDNNMMISSLNTTLVNGIFSLNLSISECSIFLQELNNSINNINTSNQDVLDFLALLNISVSEINTSNQEVINLLGLLNNSFSNNFDNLEDLIVALNSSLYDNENLLLQINSSLHNRFDSVDSSLLFLENAVITINNTLNGVVVNIDSLEQYLITINGTINGIDNVVLTINGTLQEVLSLSQSINSTIIIVNDKIDQVLQNQVHMNATINTIQNNTLSLQVKTNNIYNLLTNLSNNFNAFVINVNTSFINLENNILFVNESIYELHDKIDYLQSDITYLNGSIETIDYKLDYINNSLFFIDNKINYINTSIFYLNGSIESLHYKADTINNNILYLNDSVEDVILQLSQVNTLLLTINDTTFSIENITLANYELLIDLHNNITSLYNLTIVVNGSVMSLFDEFIFLQELINNQTVLLLSALADISYFDGVNESDYVINHSVVNKELYSGQLLNTRLTTIQSPIEGSSFKVFYYLFDQNGILQQETVSIITGNKTHNIYTTTNELQEGKYYVWSRIEMLNGLGFYQSLPLSLIDEIKVLPKSTSTRQQYDYDITVTTVYNNYDINDRVTGKIIITNKNHNPTAEAILIYWLEDKFGNVYMLTTEQVEEYDIGVTTIYRTLLLPENSEYGEWSFHAKYDTMIQPEIKSDDSFMLMGMTIWQKSNERIPIFIKGNLLLSYIIIALFVVFLISLTTVLRSRNTKEESKHLKARV